MSRAILLLLLLVPSVALAQDWAPVVAKVSPGVLRMETVDGDDSGICSVVVINKAAGYAVTAAHCIGGPASSHAVANRDVTVVAVNRPLDLAVIRIAKLHRLTSAVNVPVRQTDAPVGTPVAIVGYALGDANLKAQFGHVSELASGLVDGRMLSDASVFPGDSGGAMLDASGQLVAVTSAVLGRKGFPNAFAVGSDGEALRLFVEDYLPAAVTVARK